MNRFLFGTALAFIAFIGIFVSSCNKKDGGSSSSGNAFKIAYVKTDTLAEAYEYYNDLKTSLMLQQQEMEQDLNARYKSLQTKSMQIQRDLQDRMITPTSAQEKQEKLQLELQKFQEDQQRYELEMAEKSQKLTLEILDSIQNYLKIYNKDKNFSMILNSDTLGSNLLYADKSLDITVEVIKGLNKRYNLAKGTKEDDKTDVNKEEKDK
jgi:outer membrane protein